MRLEMSTSFSKKSKREEDVEWSSLRGKKHPARRDKQLWEVVTSFLHGSAGQEACLGHKTVDCHSREY